ncbi:SRPBCC family protein [Paenibacillus aurantius]|uniref:SRPBCC family protein n=1 Tax=Paenibacillus aurantius TaxID=2918900 RepID=A0AA96LGY8_9BACL|nr:SRPBCC family protein [Paenibacillus aurantius]WNQ11885.1 SRPBCC family protein [Paenibacillus aurantius]
MTSQAKHTKTTVEGRELIVERLMPAPRELVFQTWTKQEHLQNWWGPKGFTITVQEIEVKPGGVWRYVMHGPDGVDYDNVIRYREVVRPERLVYSHGDSVDEEQFQVTVTFAEEGSQTDIVMRMAFRSAEELQVSVERYGAVEGAASTLDRLEEELARL